MEILDSKFPNGTFHILELARQITLTEAHWLQNRLMTKFADQQSRQDPVAIAQDAQELSRAEELNNIEADTASFFKQIEIQHSDHSNQSC
ncbi:MAG: hypothetical protein LBR09_02695 [Endomicrobium sp.]|nr:hypothetical protein [Endomicrobium sp.]